MGIKCGIVGLPNVGKSTLFNALTKSNIQAENYPFCTIDPHVGVVPIPDQRLQQLATIVKPQKILPTTIEFVDIAGLVKGAASGEGLGNKFLANIRETNAIVHVVRCFEDPDIIHVADKIDPIDDITTIDLELLLADLETVSKALLKIGKNAKSGNKDSIAEQELLQNLKQHLEQELPARSFTDITEVGPLQLLTAKPIMYIANVAEDGFKNNVYLNKVIELAAKQNAAVVPICAAIEAEISQLSPEDATEFLADLGLAEPGLTRVIQAGYKLLNLQTYFTAGEQEVRAWTIKTGATAPEAAGEIHTDFTKGFIRAEVIGFTDFITNDGESGAKEAGVWRLEGKDYIVQDGDVMHFRFNV